MSDSHSDVPNVKIIPPLVYLAGIVIGIAISIWMPTKIAPDSLAWTLGGILIICGAVLWLRYFEIQRCGYHGSA